MAARIDRGRVQLLTRTGLDWTAKYPATAEELRKLEVRQAYLDGELCGFRPDGVTDFGLSQAATGARHDAGLVFFLFDLLHLDGDDVARAPLLERKDRLAEVLAGRRWRCSSANTSSASI